MKNVIAKGLYFGLILKIYVHKTQIDSVMKLFYRVNLCYGRFLSKTT